MIRFGKDGAGMSPEEGDDLFAYWTDQMADISLSTTDLPVWLKDNQRIPVDPLAGEQFREQLLGKWRDFVFEYQLPPGEIGISQARHLSRYLLGWLDDEAPLGLNTPLALSGVGVILSASSLDATLAEIIPISNEEAVFGCVEGAGYSDFPLIVDRTDEEVFLHPQQEVTQALLLQLGDVAICERETGEVIDKLPNIYISVPDPGLRWCAALAL